MYLIIAISAILAVSVADPLGCCIPSRWHGWLMQNEGRLEPNDTMATAIDNIIEIHFDYTQQKQTIVSHQMDTDTGVRDNVTIIYDYKNGVQYILPQDGSCVTEKVDTNSMFNPCTPQNYTYGGSFTIGSTIKNFQVNVFEGMLGSLRLSLLVTAQDCYPVADKVHETKGPTQLVGGFMFMDIDPNGVDDSRFTVPAKCHTGPGAVGVGKRDLDLELLQLKRRPFSYPEES